MKQDNYAIRSYVKGDEENQLVLVEVASGFTYEQAKSYASSLNESKTFAHIRIQKLED